MGDRLWAAIPSRYAVVKLLSNRWWIPVGERLEEPKLEPEGPKGEVGFPTADQMYTVQSGGSQQKGAGSQM